MSGQWEVVSKNKKSAQNGKTKTTKEEKSKIPTKVQEPQPLQQPKSDNNDKDAKSKSLKENNKNADKKNNPKKLNDKKPQEQPKPKSQKSADGGLKQQLNPGEKTVPFPELLKRLPTTAGQDSSASEVTSSLLEYLKTDKKTYSKWKQVYGKNVKQSVYLLSHIKLTWNKNKKVLNANLLKDTINEFQKQNNEILSKNKKKDETLVESNKVCQDILDKMSRSRGFPWYWASFTLLFSIIGLVIFDANQAGSFEKSSTGKFLKDVGAYDHLTKAFQQSLGTTARGYIWLENNTPYYYNSAVEFSRPYAAFTYDLALVGAKAAKEIYGNVKEYASEKTPVVAGTIEHYAPGLIENVQGYSSKAWVAVRDFSVYYYGVSSEYLQTKIFIGEWAPDVLRAKTISALNSTQLYAAQYYDWFHKQVDVYSKVK